MLITLIVVFSLVVLFQAVNWSILLFEKDHVRNDVAPKAYDPAAWSSAYLREQEAAARNAGLGYCGSYFTTANASMVKGYMLLFVTPDGRAIVSLVSARICGLELKKTVVSSHFDDRTALSSSDGIGTPDYTGCISRHVDYGASLGELLAAQKERVRTSGKTVVPATTANAFFLYEDIECARAERLVALGDARWTNETRTAVRRTFQGARAMRRANRAVQKAVIERERLEAARAK